MLSIKRLITIVLVVVAIVVVYLVYVALSNGPVATPAESSGQEVREFLERKDVEQGDKPGVWLAGDPQAQGSVQDNIRAYLEGLHIDIVGEGRCARQNLDDGDVLIFCTPGIGTWMEPDELTAYIAAGGRVILAAGVDGIATDSALMEALGIRKLLGEANSHELAFDEPFFPVQPDEMRFDGASGSHLISLIPEEDVRVCIRDAQTDNPIVYTREWKEGSVCVINGEFLEDVQNMGLLTGAMSEVVSDFIYPVLGTRTLFLDNFPCPSAFSDEDSRAMYGYSAEGFVRDVVWPTFQGISLRTGTPVTAALAISASASDNLQDFDDEVITTVGSYVLKFNGELVYVASEESETSQELLDRYSMLFPEYDVRGLVLNKDLDGKDLVTDLPDTATGDIEAVRGWLADSTVGLNWKDDMAMYPAATTGAVRMEDGGIFSLCSVLGAYGMVSHVLDADEMAMAWDSAKRELGTLETEVLDKARWLEGRTLTATRDDVRSYETMDYNWTVDGNTIQLDCSGIVKGQAFLFRPDSDIQSAQGLEYQLAGNGYYLLRVQEDMATITLDGGS